MNKEILEVMKESEDFIAAAAVLWKPMKGRIEDETKKHRFPMQEQKDS